ncbi:MAG: MFS transporter [Oscillospiraceae bacterium]|nr:MFS transporter [Oscillospiraceae bacterium]
MKKDMSKYYPAALIMYLNYFIHGVGCSVLGQAVIKESLAASWGVEAMSITAISAALGLGRLIALPFAGPLSDKLGRKISTMIGGLSYAVYLLGLMFAFKAGTNGGYQIAYVCAVIGGIANSFLDTGIYPALGEILSNMPDVATMGVKFFISISQMLLPFFLGMAVTTTTIGNGTSYTPLFVVCGIAYLVLAILIFIVPLPDTDAAAAGKKEGLLESLKHTKFSIESIAMILVGFTCTGTFQLWLNCAQNYARDVVGWENPSIMQTYYSFACLIVLVGTAFLTKFIKNVRFIVVYPCICLAAMVLCLIAPSQTMMLIGAVCVGGFGSGGLLQIATAVCNMCFPKIKGTVTALVMIASSLCNYTLLTAAAKMTPSGVMTMNIVLTGVGIALGLFVNLRYATLTANVQEK